MDRVRLALHDLRPSLFSEAAPRAAFLTQLRLAESQWWERQRHEQHQLARLKNLVRFAATEVPFWRARLKPDYLDDASTLAEALARLPILSRDHLHDEGKSLRAQNLPKGHAHSGQAVSSGSTGLVVRVADTNVFQQWQKILGLRSHLWAGYDFRRTLAVIRKGPPGVAEYPDGKREPRWAGPTVIPFPTGPAWQLNTHASIEEQWEWLGRVRPAYLFTTPSLVKGLAKCGPPSDGFALSGISTVGEVVDNELRALAASGLKAKIHDRYSSEEAGSMALQCPDAPGYHVQAEAVIVEILDEQGSPCGPGEIGRVVVTPLLNFATPLIRYELGDYAELGGACRCGRGLPLINRIMGRRRNILVGPDGRHYWPSLESYDFFAVAESRAHQFRQVEVNLIEVCLVVDSPRTPEQEAEMRRLVTASLPFPCEVRFRYVSEFPRHAAGKHEEFVSYVAAPPPPVAQS